MFKLSERYQIDGRILECDYLRPSPSEISTINTDNSQMYFNIPREDSPISLLKSYLDLNFDVLHAATNNRYVDADDIWLINLAAIALFSNFKLTTSSGKHLENIDHAHTVSLMYKVLTSSRGSDDLSIGFDRDRNRRKRELTNNQNIKGKYHMKIYLEDIFGFAEHQEKAPYGLGYKLTSTRNWDNVVSNKTNATAFDKIKINSIEWYEAHYTASLKEQGIIMKQITDKIPTELRYVERSVFMKEVNTQNLWGFDLGTHENMNVPIWIIVGFQQRDRQDSQTLVNDSFCRLLITSAQCVISTEKYPDSAVFLSYDDDDFNQGYGLIKEAFKALTKDDIVEPYISEHNFRTSNDGNNNGYNFYVFDVRYQRKFESAQPIKVEF